MAASSQATFYPQPSGKNIQNVSYNLDDIMARIHAATNPPGPKLPVGQLKPAFPHSSLKGSEPIQSGITSAAQIGAHA